MRELSLFTGAGGGVLGTTLLGWEHCGYVEWDTYCQRVIRQRIIDGILDEAPIFCDVRAFIGEGYAAAYKGMVDVVTAGFPCQPFSVAGKRKGVDDERNMWPATADVIRIVRPRFVLLENVPGIREYLPVVIRDLRRLGYSVRRPLILGAGDVGAPHKRDRIWIVARDTESNTGNQIRTIRQGAHTITERVCATVADTESGKDHRRERRNVDEEVQRRQGEYTAFDTCREDVAYAYSTGREEQRRTEPNGAQHEALECGSWWIVEPDVGRVANGVASRVDRLKAIGNGQVPAVVRAAWEILSFQHQG